MQRKYSEEEKYQLVERYCNGESVSDICTATGVAKSTFYTWIKPYQTQSTSAGYVVSAAEYAKMRKRIAKLEEIIKVLKNVDCTASASRKEKLNALAVLYGKYSVHSLCEALEVPRGTFYNHILRNKRENNSYQARRDYLSERIKQVFDESNQIYGAMKIKAVLAEQGEVISDKMVSELMREMNLCSMRTSAKKTYLRLERGSREKKKDSLQMQFSVSTPNHVWVSDTTHFKLNNQHYFICVIIDLFSRKVVAHSISPKHSTQLITGSFKSAYKIRQPDNGLIFHSDRGTQYTAYSFEKLLKACKTEHSFSPTGRPCHNAVMESFFSSMKKEELYRTNYHSVGELKKRISQYIEFYNTERPHATLNYKTPSTYERLFYERNL